MRMLQQQVSLPTVYIMPGHQLKQLPQALKTLTETTSRLPKPVPIQAPPTACTVPTQQLQTPVLLTTAPRILTEATFRQQEVRRGQLQPTAFTQLHPVETVI